MATLLAKKSRQLMTTNDQAHEALAADPAVQEFPPGSTFESFASRPSDFDTSSFNYTSNNAYNRSVGNSTVSQTNHTTSIATSGGALHEGPAKTMIKADEGFSEFINRRWRPLMAVQYMITCLTDFVVFPVLWSILQTLQGGQVTSQWIPLTLQGAGLYHIAMGAVLGLAAYGRSQEKIAGKAA